MKYNFFSGGKSGKYQLRQIFLNNNKTHAIFCCGVPPVHAAMMTPDYKWDWYWEDLDGKLVHETYQDRKPQVGEEWAARSQGYHKETWFYRKTDGDYNIKKYLKRRPELRVQEYACDGFYKCFEHAFKQDIIVNPLPMMGYVGMLGCGKLSKRLRERRPNMSNAPLNYVLDNFNKRKNFIAHKEDIRKLAFNFFADANVPSHISEEQIFDKVSKKIDENIQFANDIADILDYYNISYEWFNLDKDDYKVFGVTDVPDRNVSDNVFDTFTTSRDKIDQWVENYMRR